MNERQLMNWVLLLAWGGTGLGLLWAYVTGEAGSWIYMPSIALCLVCSALLVRRILKHKERTC